MLIRYINYVLAQNILNSILPNSQRTTSFLHKAILHFIKHYDSFQAILKESWGVRLKARILCVFFQAQLQAITKTACRPHVERAVVLTSHLVQSQRVTVSGGSCSFSSAHPTPTGPAHTHICTPSLGPSIQSFPICVWAGWGVAGGRGGTWLRHCSGASSSQSPTFIKWQEPLFGAPSAVRQTPSPICADPSDPFPVPRQGEKWDTEEAGTLLLFLALW